ncbi:division/cell wall cluster transcriptional repressor MraZ [endosymbiont of unidentified scaly snail isolate Monju]|uniref:division/cell wall cluster transcriptional repressor MraZ n=1 Tax=endosymbiont of unidentified scaly snail isolate Monju TaxID=1248727 RepID=UPI00038925E9|nr:division/cell wall cluster transcriptional repressor MraZ [endosymbiont of unidentified scaly snail isolate Monju]BAN68393.1 MraZ protein [endosymbiont of unidentified scaly snail isolate Monju]
MFLGVNTLNLDAKGRMAIPARYRNALAECCGSRVVVTINPREHCLWLYPETEWQEIARKVARLPTLNRQNLILQRLLLGHASELEMDGQGRILLSAELREYARLGKKVSLIGQGQKFEIWDAESMAAEREGWLQEAGELDGELSGDLAELRL